jgi:glutaconate CoA-transferase, subunit A
MEFTTLSQAISNIKDGSLITFSGMELNRAPMALIYEIVRQGKKGLKTISIPNPLATDVLIKAGCVKHATFGFNGFSFEDGFVIAPNWRRAVENESIQWKETDPIEIVMGLKASSLGIKEIEVPGFKNTDYLKFNKYKRVIKNDEKVILANAITPDFALIHAQYADKGGNVFIEDPLIDNLIANASKNIIVSVEKIVKKLDKITIRSEKINCIIKAERGGLADIML